MPRGQHDDAVLPVAAALAAVFIDIEVAILFGVALSVIGHVPKPAMTSREVGRYPSPPEALLVLQTSLLLLLRCWRNGSAEESAVTGEECHFL